MNICDENSAPLLVPRLLYGPSRSKSHRRWRTVAKLAAKTGSWEEALKGVEFMAIDDVKGDFACNNSKSTLFDGDNLWLNDTFEILFSATADHISSLEDPDPDGWAKLLEALTVSGLDHFWFALCVCISGVGIVIWRDVEERRRATKRCLRKLLHWWPQICYYDKRFSGGQKLGDIGRGWPSWSGGLGDLCRDAGIEDELRSQLVHPTPETVGRIVAELLNR